ncbi:ARM repeat-containing protein [Hypomontagnella monticulosa]|nr:ARM repeat-containing protein [Hypomontagnella monticulosa]
MTPDEIQNLFDNIPGDEESRVQALNDVLTTAQTLQEANSPDLKTLAEKVGNGSREERWRIPLGRSGLVDFFLGLLEGDEIDPDLTAHALRVIGNSCADQDENRQRVVDSGRMPQLVKLLTHDSLLKFAIPVLFNICVDYEPAQVAACKARLSGCLIDLLGDPRLLEKASALMNITYKLLGLSATQDFEPESINPQAPYLLLAQVCLMASNPDAADFDGFLGLSSAALGYLSHQQFQDTFLETKDSIKTFLVALQIATEASRIFAIDEGEEQAQLNQLQLTYTQTLADLSANSRFVSLCPLDGSPTDLLLDWISSSQYVQLQTAACLALGNLARSDAPSTTLVQKISVHQLLIPILSDPSTTDAQLLHSILSFLKNLAIPANNKAILGTGLLHPDVLPRIWNLDTQPQVQFDAVSLARLLLVNTPENVRLICTPSHAQTQTPLQQLMDLHRKADQEPIKMETARAVANVCRVLHSDKPVGTSLLPSSSTSVSEEEARSVLQAFYDQHPALADTLVYLGLQPKFPVLRSELWFVLALMARSAEGASVVAHGIQQHPKVVDVLVEAVTGRKVSEQDTSSNPPEAPGLDVVTIGDGLGQLEPQQVDPARATTMTKVDRENGLVLISELLRRCSDDLPSSARNTLGQILKIGGELVGNGNEDLKGEAQSVAG